MGRLLKTKIINFLPATTAAILYWKTLLVDIDFWDTGEFQIVGATFDLPHPTGFPLYIILLKIANILLPFGNTAFKANFLSLIFVCIGIFFFSLTIGILTKNKILSIITPAIISVSYPLWFVGNRADPHSLNFLLISVFLYLAIKYRKEEKTTNLLLASFFLGLALANHPISSFFIPTLIILLIFSKQRITEKIKSLVIFLIPLTLYLIIPLIYSLKGVFTIDYPLDSLKNISRYILAKDFSPQTSFYKGNLTEKLVLSIESVKKYIPLPYLLFSFFGIILGISSKKERMITTTLFIPLLANLIFVANYPNAVIERYYIPALSIILIFASISIGKIIEKGKKLEFLIILVFVTATSVFINKSIVTNFPILDQSKNFQARLWAEEVLNNSEKDAVIFSWWSYSTPLWYLQKVEEKRKDITIINTGQENWEEEAKTLIDKRPVYFIEKINLKEKDLVLEESGLIYKIKKQVSIQEPL